MSPWVVETRDPRPRTRRFVRRRVVEAETCRGFFAASANFRAKATVTPRPRALCHRTQGGGKARIAWLGYGVKPLQGKVLRRLAQGSVAVQLGFGVQPRCGKDVPQPELPRCRFYFCPDPYLVFQSEKVRGAERSDAVAAGWGLSKRGS